VLDCKPCGMEVHWVQGVSMADPGHWGHRHPAPHGEPVRQRSEGSSPATKASTPSPWAT
jgi:hypothetical protein